MSLFLPAISPWMPFCCRTAFRYLTLVISPPGTTNSPAAVIWEHEPAGDSQETRLSVLSGEPHSDTLSLRYFLQVCAWQGPSAGTPDASPHRLTRSPIASQTLSCKVCFCSPRLDLMGHPHWGGLCLVFYLGMNIKLIKLGDLFVYFAICQLASKVKALFLTPTHKFRQVEPELLADQRTSWTRRRSGWEEF